MYVNPATLNNNGTSTDSTSMSETTTVTMTTDAIDVTSDNNPSNNNGML